MAINSVYTFPSAVRGLPHAYAPSGLGGVNTSMDMGDTGNSIHQSGMEWAKQYVNARARIMNHNDRVMLRGGYRNMLPKPQPQGSFQMVYTNSGSNGYGYAGMRGSGGSFRTKSGAEYGRQRLRERGEQLNTMMIEKEEGMPVGLPTAEQPVPLDKMETDKIVVSLLIDNIYSSYGEDPSLKEIDVKEVDKLFNQLRGVVGMDFEFEELQDLRSKFGEIMNSIRDEMGTPQTKSVAIARVYYLIDALAESVYLQPKDRKKYLNSMARNILKKIKEDEDIFTDPIQSVPPNLRRVSEGEVKDKLEEGEALAPEVQLARFIPDPTKRERIKTIMINLQNKDKRRKYVGSFGARELLNDAMMIYAEETGDELVAEPIEDLEWTIDDDEAERVVASAVPTSMRPTGTMAMPDEVGAEVIEEEPASIPSRRGKSSKSQEYMIKLLRDYRNSGGDLNDEEARILIEKVKGKKKSTINKIMEKFKGMVEVD